MEPKGYRVLYFIKRVGGVIFPRLRVAVRDGAYPVEPLRRRMIDEQGAMETSKGNYIHAFRRMEGGDHDAEK